MYIDQHINFYEQLYIPGVDKKCRSHKLCRTPAVDCEPQAMKSQSTRNVLMSNNGVKALHDGSGFSGSACSCAAKACLGKPRLLVRG